MKYKNKTVTSKNDLTYRLETLLLIIQKTPLRKLVTVYCTAFGMAVEFG